MQADDVDPNPAATRCPRRRSAAGSVWVGLGLVCVAVLACNRTSALPTNGTSPSADTTSASDDASTEDEGTLEVEPEDGLAPETSPSPECGGEPFSEAFIRRAIGTLAQPAWEGRRFDSVGLRQAVSWVRDQFACLGLTPGAPGLPGLPDTDFLQSFETDGDEIEPASEISDYTYDPDATYTFTNVVGSIPGTGELAAEVVVVGAHLDHLGNYGRLGDALVLGANDDASGILALLALARQIGREPAPASRRTLVFVAWGVEEDPFYLRGSQAFVGAMNEVEPTTTERIQVYVNFDMIGSYRGQDALYLLGAYDRPPGTQLAESPAHRIAWALVGDYP